LALAAGEITEIAPFVPHKEETEPPRHFSSLRKVKRKPRHVLAIADRGFSQAAPASWDCIIRLVLKFNRLCNVPKQEARIAPGFRNANTRQGFGGAGVMNALSR